MTIPNETHARIVGMCQGGMKGVEIADKVGVLVWTIQRIVKQIKEDGNFKSHTSRGRPKLLSKRDVQNIILFSRSNCRASHTKINQCMPCASEYYDYSSYFA
jgi:transposase